VKAELAALEEQLEMIGYIPGTPAFEKEYRRQKVDLCKQFQGVDSCWSCKAFDHCSLIKARLRDMRNSLENLKNAES
jgi:hypothetical protein